MVVQSCNRPQVCRDYAAVSVANDTGSGSPKPSGAPAAPRPAATLAAAAAAAALAALAGPSRRFA